MNSSRMLRPGCCLFLALPPTLTEAYVEPWYASQKLMIFEAPLYSWASLMATSFASVPLFPKKVLQRSPGVIWASLRASWIWGTLK